MVLRKKTKAWSPFTLAAAVQGLHTGFSNGFAAFPKGQCREEGGRQEKRANQLPRKIFDEVSVILAKKQTPARNVCP